MKLLLPLGVGALVFLVAAYGPMPRQEGGVHGRYLELRDAAVFAGACHVNGEVDHQGRRALLAFDLEGGVFDGVDLSGVELAVAVGSTDNLARGAERTGVAFVDENLAPSVQRAAIAWLQARHGDELGLSGGARCVPLDLTLEGERFALEVPGVARAEGSLLPDRACCSMPEDVWYEPLAGQAGAVVGQALSCRFEGTTGIEPWTYEGQNNAFVGAFADEPCGAPAPCAAPTGVPAAP